MGKSGRHSHLFGISSVHVSSCGAKIRAEILHTCTAKFTFPASRVNPGNPYPVANLAPFSPFSERFDLPYSLMPKDYRQVRRRHPPFDFIQFSMANATGA